MPFAALSASEGFSASQLRRAFLPGLIAAIGLHAYLPATVATSLGRPFELNANVIFLIEVVLYGFLITSSATPIFYLYEGFSAAWLTRPARVWHEWKVARCQATLKHLYDHNAQESERARQIRSYLTDFPVKADDGGYTYEVERPTRIGNLIATFELYPERVYGVDGVYFWYHLTFLAPKESRDDVDEKTSSAESILLSSGAGAGVALIALSEIAGRALGRAFPVLALFPSLVSLRVAWESFALGAGAFMIFYRLSWSAYRALRDSFRTMVDLAMPTFQEWIEQAPTALPVDLAKKAETVTEYMSTLVPHRRKQRR